MGGIVFKAIQKKGKDKLTSKYSSLHDIPTTDIDGNPVKRIGDIVNAKKCIMVVNVASK